MAYPFTFVSLKFCRGVDTSLWGVLNFGVGCQIKRVNLFKDLCMFFYAIVKLNCNFFMVMFSISLSFAFYSPAKHYYASSRHRFAGILRSLNKRVCSDWYPSRIHGSSMERYRSG